MQKQEKSGKTQTRVKGWLKYLGAIVAFLVVITGVFWLMTVRIEQGYTSIDSTIGEVSDEEENSDMDMLLNRRFQLQKSSKDNSPRKKSICVEYAFHGTDENGFDYILFFAQQDIVNNTWSFSVSENFTDVYYPA